MLLRNKFILSIDLTYFSFFVVTLHIKNYSLWINEVIIHNDVGISSFQNGLNNSLTSTGFYFNSEIIEGSHEVKNNIPFSFRALSS